MKICFVINDVALSGGTGVVIRHAHQLATRHGHEVVLAVLDRTPEAWRHHELAALQVVDFEQAAADSYDVAIATWWKTCYRLFALRAERYAYFVQSLEDRFYEPHSSDRVLAATTHSLPISVITEARWIRDTLRQLRPDEPVYFVRNGIDKCTFSPPAGLEPRTKGPLRILLEGHPEVWFKGIREASEVVGELDEPHVVTFVSPSGRDAVPRSGADRVIGPLGHDALADEYAQTDVLLKLSHVEGMYGPPLEGFHMGATCVTTPVTGHEEYISHGFNALVADWNDTRGAARLLDLLARDRRLLHQLRTNAWLTARSWPSWEQSGQFMAASLQLIRDRPPPSPYPAAARMLDDLLAGVSETGRAAHRLRMDLDQARRDVHNVIGEADRLRGELLDKGDELGDLLRSEQWRLGGRALAVKNRPAVRLARRCARFARRRLGG